MFWFKRNKVYVDCFINNRTVYDLFKIDYTSKFIPDGWKSSPSHVDMKVHSDPRSKLTAELPTLKRCVALTNLFGTGFVIPAWTDFKVEMMADGKFYKSDPQNNLNIDNHPRFMYWKDLYEDYGHIKIYSPWLIRETTGIKFTWNQFDWDHTDRLDKFHILSGVLDFKAQYGSHINAFVKENTLLDFKAGEPLVHVVPITEKELVLKCHLVDDVEYKKIYMTYYNRSMYSGNHRALYNLEKEKKCPFRIFGV
jgi:hypothetical protein